MLKKANRVTSTLFKSLEGARGEHTKNFFIKFTENLEGGENKFAIIVPKKVNKNAVVRNRVKRRISAVLEDGNFTKSKHKPLFVVIYAKSGVQNLSAKDIKKELEYSQVFHRL